MLVIKYSESQQNNQQLLVGNFFHNIFKSAEVLTTFNSGCFFFFCNSQESINLKEEVFDHNISLY